MSCFSMQKNHYYYYILHLNWSGLFQIGNNCTSPFGDDLYPIDPIWLKTEMIDTVTSDTYVNLHLKVDNQVGCELH